MVVEFLSNKWKEDIKPLDFVADYHGEKFAFYFAWLIHYTAFLLPPSIFGIIIYIAQIIIWRTKNPQMYLNDATDTFLNCVYSLFIALWTTLFVESWKRKENYLANRWLVRDYEATSFDRDQFKACLNIDTQLRTIWKQEKENQARIWLGTPVTVLFMALVVGVYVGIHYWATHISNLFNPELVQNGVIQYVTPQPKPTNYVALVYQQVPNIVLTVIIILAGETFKIVATKIVDKENHRDNVSYENALILKNYYFSFVNSYISCFIMAFWARNVYELSVQLATIIVIKQIVFNLLELFQYSGYVKSAVLKVTNHFNKLK